MAIYHDDVDKAIITGRLWHVKLTNSDGCKYELHVRHDDPNTARIIAEQHMRIHQGFKGFAYHIQVDIVCNLKDVIE